MDAFELVAVEYADMMIAGLDHDEQVHHVGDEDRTIAQFRFLEVLDARGANLRFAPVGPRRDRRVDPVGELLDFLRREFGRERRPSGWPRGRRE